MYFNHRSAQGTPEFSGLDDSSQTELPINLGGVNASGLVPDLSSLESTQADRFPLVDTVRFWIAPFKGSVKVTGPVVLLTASGSSKADGVHASLWKHEMVGGQNTLLWQTDIGPQDTSAKTPIGVASVAVSAGDRLYFRTSSKYDAQDDAVLWDPVVEYVGSGVTPFQDANNLEVLKYQASKDFVMEGRNDVHVRVPFQGQVKLTGKLAKPLTSDDIEAVVLRNGLEVSGTKVDRAYNSTVPIAFDATFSVSPGDRIQLQIKSDSPVDLHGIVPLVADDVIKLVYVSAVDAQNQSIPVIGPQGEYLFQLDLPYDADIYSVLFPSSGASTPPPPPHKVDTSGSLQFTATVQTNAPTQRVHFTLKSSLQRLASGDFDFPAGGTKSLTFDVPVAKDQKLYFDFSTRETDASKFLAANITGATIGGASIGTVTSYLNKAVDQDRCTRPYRRWGVGALDGNKALYQNPIPDTFCEDELAVLDKSYSPPDNPFDAIGAAELVRNEQLTYLLFPFPGGRKCAGPGGVCPLPTTPLWGATDEDVYVSGLVMSPGRHGANDVGVPDSASVAGAFAPKRLSYTNQTTFSLGASVLVAGASVSRSASTSRSIVDYMDMNGDGFPDVVSAAGVQYTSPRGSLDERHGVLDHARDSEGVTYNVGIDGNAPISLANSKGRQGGTGTALANGAGPAEQMPSLGFGINAGKSLGWSDSRLELHDINGDGLPDQVFRDGNNLKVRLNYGYAFGPPEVFDDGSAINLGNSEETNGGAGLSFNDGRYGFGGGLSAASGTTRIREHGAPTGLEQKEGETLLDVNGDGLLDRVRPVIGANPGEMVFKVRINTGNRFAAEVDWTGVPLSRDVTESANRSLGEGAYFTYGFGPLCIGGCYIIVNPGYDASQGMNRQEVMVSDIDGDGYPDHLTSHSDSSVTVARNRTGRTNLLKVVRRPLKASFEVDYSRAGNQPNHPQSRWVLSRVTTFDGFPGDWTNQNPGADYQLTTYSYESGFYDRFEREFYGFAKITETEHDTRGLTSVPASFSKPYRKTERLFANDSFFSTGLLLRETVTGLDTGTPKLFTDVQNAYTLREVSTGNPLTDKKTLSAVFPELTQTLRVAHEGNPAVGIATLMLYEYDAVGNVTKMIDSGDAGSDDDFTATMTYTGTPGGLHSGCASNNIVGLADSITVKSATGQTLRHREASFNCTTGDLLALDQTINGTQSANSQFTYQSNGNLQTVKGPQNLHGARYSLAFNYDATTQSHVVTVTDSFGYASTATYDLRYGVVKSETDPNGNVIDRTYDEFGRLRNVTGPYELGAHPYTLRFEYHPEATTPFAITDHINVFRGDADPITTILFIDGLKRVTQTKKRHHPQGQERHAPRHDGRLRPRRLRPPRPHHRSLLPHSRAQKRPPQRHLQPHLRRDPADHHRLRRNEPRPHHDHSRQHLHHPHLLDRPRQVRPLETLDHDDRRPRQRKGHLPRHPRPDPKHPGVQRPRPGDLDPVRLRPGSTAHRSPRRQRQPDESHLRSPRPPHADRQPRHRQDPDGLRRGE